MSSTQQKAFAIPEKMGPWKLVDRPVPKPAKDQVLVKIHATALNPVDWKVQKYGAFTDKFSGWPAVQGSDAAGEIAEIGGDVTNFAKGDRVVFQGLFTDSDLATFQQYALVPAEIVAKIPSTMTFDQASTLPLGVATAAVGFYNDLTQGGAGLKPFWEEGGKGKYSGQSIVVLGGSSSVGQYAIQLARESGYSPIITTSSTKHADFLKSLGATHVVDRKGDTVAEIKSILNGGLTGVVFDTISSDETQVTAIKVSAPDGIVILTLSPAKAFEPGKRTVVNMFGNVHVQRVLGVSLYKALPGLLENGTIKPNRVELVPGGLQGIETGLAKMAADQVSGVKLVVRPWE